MFVTDYFKGINSFDYINEYEEISKEYTYEILNKVFNEEKTVISIVNGNQKSEIGNQKLEVRN